MIPSRAEALEFSELTWFLPVSGEVSSWVPALLLPEPPSALGGLGWLECTSFSYCLFLHPSAHGCLPGPRSKPLLTPKSWGCLFLASDR